MRLLFALPLVFASASDTSAQDLTDALYIKIGIDQAIVYPLPEDILVEHDFRLTLDDGVEISMNIYRPNTTEKVPVIMSFTSYDKDMKPETYIPFTRGGIYRKIGLNLGDMTISSEALWEGADAGFWVPNGYAVVTVDARGTGKSDGKKDPFSDKTVQGFVQAIEWASEQPWSTGKIGSTGVSYLGIIQWYIAAERPRGLVAMNVWEGLSELLTDAAYHGGIPETAFVPFWMGGHGGHMDPNAQPRFGMTDLPKIPSIKDFTEYSIPDINVGNINVPALITATWSTQGLHSRGSFAGYMKLNTEKYLYTHGAEEWTVSQSTEAREYQKAFFDYYLKGDESAREKLMNVRLEVRKGDEEFYVREENEWPLTNIEYKKLYLDGYNSQLVNEPLSVNTMTQYDSVNVNDEVVLSYTFDKDTEVIGYSRLKLWVSTTLGNDLDLFVGIRKIGADGKARQFWNLLQQHEIAARGWQRVSLRKLDAERTSDLRPILSLDEYQPVQPAEIVSVEIEILPYSVLFEEGSRLELILKGSDIVRSPMQQHMKLVNMGYHNIFAGKDYDSYLVLPIAN